MVSDDMPYVCKTPDQSADIGKLVAAICEVMLEVPAVGASSRAHQGYAYTSDAELLCSLQPSMARHGVAVIPMRSVPNVVARTTERGKEAVRVDLVQAYRICHSSGQWMTAEVMGCGVDTQDKAAYKAMTGSLKYVLRQVFAVPTGDDAERTVARREREQSAMPAPQDVDRQAEKISKRLKDVKVAAELSDLFAAAAGLVYDAHTSNPGSSAARTLVQLASSLTPDHTRKQFLAAAWDLVVPARLTATQSARAVELYSGEGQTKLRQKIHKLLPQIVRRMQEPAEDRP